MERASRLNEQLRLRGHPTVPPGFRIKEGTQINAAGAHSHIRHFPRIGG